MTAPTSPAAPRPPAGAAGKPRRRNKSKELGTKAETAVARYLAANGWPHAERRSLRGTRDAGDITGCPGLCIQVKGGEAARAASDLDITRWLEALEIQRRNARADVGVLVVQRRAVGLANAGRWWAIWRFDELVTFAAGRFMADNPAPVRMLLADAVTLLRAAGYGDALDEEVS